MATAERVDNQIRLTAEFREKDLCKSIPGSRWDRKEGVWYAPLSWATAWVLKGTFGNSLEVGPELQKWVRDELDLRVSPSMKLRDRGDVPEADDPLHGYSLYPFQRVGARFLLTAGRALLADDMGTGKTVQTSVALRELGTSGLPALIVAPNSVKWNWKEELEKWYPEMKGKIAVVEGSIAERRRQIDRIVTKDAEILIINWEALRSHSRLAPYGSIALRRCSNCEATSTNKPQSCEYCERELNMILWQTVIADESHRGSNPKAKQTRALWWVSRTAKYRWALTGTPVTGRLDSLWAIMHFVSPEEWPSKSAFLDRYALTSWNYWGGLEVMGLQPEHKEEFFKVLDPRFLRRPKDLVLPQLPPKVYQYRIVDLSPKQRKAYNDLKKHMIAELDSGVEAVTEPIVKLRRMLQLTSAYAEVDDQGQWFLTEPSTKLDALMEVIEEAGNQGVAVFAESRQLIELAEARLTKAEIPFTAIHGKVTPAERQEAVRRFQNGEVGVFLATLATGGEGITLTRASVLVFLERSYSMVHNKQAEDRLHRIGQTADKVTIVDILADDSIDSNRLDILEGKALALEEIVRDAETLKRFIGG